MQLKSSKVNILKVIYWHLIRSVDTFDNFFHQPLIMTNIIVTTTKREPSKPPKWKNYKKKHTSDELKIESNRIYLRFSVIQKIFINHEIEISNLACMSTVGFILVFS